MGIAFHASKQGSGHAIATSAGAPGGRVEQLLSDYVAMGDQVVLEVGSAARQVVAVVVALKHLKPLRKKLGDGPADKVRFDAFESSARGAQGYAADPATTPNLVGDDQGQRVDDPGMGDGVCHEALEKRFAHDA